MLVIMYKKMFQEMPISESFVYSLCPNLRLIRLLQQQTVTYTYTSILLSDYHY